MFGLGLSEIVVILLIILVLINPKDLPKIARKLGTWARKFQEMRGKFDEEVHKVEQEIRKPFDESSKELNNGIQSSVESVNIKQPLPDLKTIMPSRPVPSVEKETSQEQTNDQEEQQPLEVSEEIVETNVYSGGFDDRSN